ncbi:hypothetical protein O181_030565 [Austropuccinia psidii MF-1]|uniref:Uncharacterized protein n=1 Tax=Austropuccinia psidii MF-1 TaxID=1389203 RepID=A0A9Q3CXG1_9BASI|nr:hypothetical protein [Austropuccinia psidii MF-1]
MDPRTPNRQTGTIPDNYPSPPSNGHFTPQTEQSDDSAYEGWQWREVIGVWADCHPCDLNAKNQTNQMPHDKTLPFLVSLQAVSAATNPGLSGTQWSEDLFREPSQMDEPPVPGLSPSSEPHEDNLTCKPEPEVAPTQSMEEPSGKSQISFFYSSHIFLTFPLTIQARPTPPHSVITIDNTPVGSPPPQCQDPLIPMMTLARNLPTYDQP